MTLTLELTPEQEERLKRRAARAGLDVAEYAKLCLDEEQSVKEMPRTPAEMVAYWEAEGLFGLFADKPDSPEFARQLRKQAETRQ